MTNDPLERARRVARDMAFGPSEGAGGPGQPPGTASGLPPTVVKALRTGGAVLVGSSILRRSRVARLIAAGGAVRYAARRTGGGDAWQDVPPPDDRQR